MTRCSRVDRALDLLLRLSSSTSHLLGTIEWVLSCIPTDYHGSLISSAVLRPVKQLRPVLEVTVLLSRRVTDELLKS